MPLLTYEDVRPRAKDIRDKVGDGVMPPWHADKAHGHFSNDRSRAKPRSRCCCAGRTMAHQGDDKDLPPAPKYVEGWSLGQPDAVIEMPVTTRCPRMASSAYT
jgi:hypothetical protein